MEAVKSQEEWRTREHFRKVTYEHPEGGAELTRLYNEWAEHYEKDTQSVGYCGPAHLAGLASNLIKEKSSRILDAASGTGMVGEELKRRGFTCIDALDPSQNSLDKSKEHQCYTEYICDTLDEHQTDIPHDSYDAVLICGTFGLPGHVTVACFPELIRITKPGGYIMFTLNKRMFDEWNDTMEEAIQEYSHKGSWELVKYRWIPYHVRKIEIKAKVPVLRVSDKRCREKTSDAD